MQKDKFVKKFVNRRGEIILEARRKARKIIYWQEKMI